MAQLLSDVLTEEETALLDTLPAETEPASHFRRYVLRDAAFALGPQPPIEYIVDGLITRGSVNVIYGEPGSKKTYSSLSLAVCVATGKDWLDFKTTPVMVLIIDEESGERRLSRRIGEALRGELADESANLFYTSLNGLKLDSEAGPAELQNLIEETSAGLVIIDALADVMDGDENSKQDVQPVFNALRRIAEATNCAVILIHHSNKGGSYRGSSAIKGSVDAMVQVTSEDGSRFVNFKSEKVRDAERKDWSAEATWSEGGQFYLTVAEDQRKAGAFSKAENFVLRFLEENGPSAKSAIKAGADTCSERAAESAIYLLTSKGKIKRTNPNERGQGKEAVYALKGGDYE